MTKIALLVTATLALATSGAVSAQAATWNNCTDVWNAGAAPIHPGDAGFQQKFDADKDGVGCEVDPRTAAEKAANKAATTSTPTSTPTSTTDLPQVATAPQGGVRTGDGSTAIKG